MDSEIWSEGLDEVCSNFQLDISCLLDNELDQGAAGRAMVHMEACECCRQFFLALSSAALSCWKTACS